MTAVIVNAAAVLLGSLLGIWLGGRVRDNIRVSAVKALAICALITGLKSALEVEDILALIICTALGTVLGEAVNVEKGIEKLGNCLKNRLRPEGRGADSSFAEGFTAASTLFCIGSMTVVGSLEAGINHDFSIIFAKSALDFAAAIAYAAAMGWGVTCSALFVLIFQGALTLLAVYAGPLLSPEIINGMTAAGGAVLIAITVNMLELGREKIRAANMLPAVFLPMLYFPLKDLILSLV